MIAILVAAAVYCGVERTDVKTLADPAQLLPADKSYSIAELRALRAPRWADHAPRSKQERQIVTLRGDIVAYKAETDNDIHVVISDGRGATLIAEFPHPDCAGKGHVKRFADARRALLQLLPKKPGRTVKLGTGSTVPVLLTGVIFFDKKHGQLGVAPNGVELHPILKIERVP